MPIHIPGATISEVRGNVPGITVGTSDADFITDGTDDDVQIQEAIDSLGAGGGTVFLKQGTYTIGSPIVIGIDKGFELVGEGWDTVIVAKSGLNGNVIEFNPSANGVWCRIANLKIDGDGGNQTGGYNIYALGALQCLFEYLWITQPFNNGIFCHQDGASGTGHHNRIINCLFDEGDNTNGGDGRAIRFEASDENYVANCDFESNGRAAASEPNHIYDLSGLQQFINNVFVGGATGIKLQGDRNRVIGNIFDGTNNHSIRINGNKNIISNNNIFNPGVDSGSPDFDGIFVDNVNNNTIIGNVIESDNAGSRSAINFANGAVTNTAVNNRILEIAGSFGTSKIIAGTGNYVKDNFDLTPVEETVYITMKNTSGGTINIGDIVTTKAVAAGNEVTTTTNQGDDLVYGMALATITNTASGKIQVLGKTTALKVDGNADIAIGDFIGTFTTGKIGMKAASGDMAIAIALEAYTTNDSNGVIDALLVTPRKI